MRLWASISSIDLGELAAIAQRLGEAGVDGIHVDMSDGIFSPDLTFGANVVSALTSRSPLPVEVHLMTVEPEHHLQVIADAGAARVSVHSEATRYPRRVAGIARDLGLRVGLAVNPATAIPNVSHLDGAIEFVNVLTTEPDTHGEKLLPAMARRTAEVRRLTPDSIRVQVDGAMSEETIGAFTAAGADEVVVGRTLVSAVDAKRQVALLRAAASQSAG